MTEKIKTPKLEKIMKIVDAQIKRVVFNDKF